MAYAFNHVHLKSPDPIATAEWYVKAFDFKIISDVVRPVGDRFVKCETSNGIVVNISGSRTGETLGEGNANAHHGLEHFGFDVVDIESEIKRLESLGATLIEGPIFVPEGPLAYLAFIKAPDNVRIEIIQPR
jgi:lactoylglutathione lyase